MADTSNSTRNSQWKHYFNFCTFYDQVPVPASLDTVLLYLAYMASSFKYVSIINYLSALWVLHKISGLPPLDPKTFEIHMTLRGIRRTLGDTKSQAPPVSVAELLMIYAHLDMGSVEDLAFWCAVILCIRGLLRKSNVVEESFALLAHDVEFYPWGVLVKVNRSKTISFKERVLEIPFSTIKGSPFCIRHHLLELFAKVGHDPSSQLISYISRARLVRGTYKWFNTKLLALSTRLGFLSFTTQSLRRGGASAMADAGFSLLEIKNLGDWSSLSVLLYLTKSPHAKLDLDERVASALFK